MIAVSAFSGKRVAVFGLGGSGLVSCHALAAGGASVIACDDDPARMTAAKEAGFSIADLRHADWSAISALVLAPGVPLTHPAPHWSVAMAHAAGVEVIGDIELFCRERRADAPDAPFVAITGTNGKSTTTALTAHLLSRAGHDVQLGGNIGTAILSLEPPRVDRSYVIEVSSYQIDLSPSLDPSVGILLNVSEDHLDRHGTLAHYAAVKERLVAGASDAAIIGIDDPWCEAAAARIEARGKTVVRISVRRKLSEGFFVKGSSIVETGRGSNRTVAHLDGISSLRGVHNAQNAACATAAALTLGLSPDVIKTGLRSFPGLPHRMEEIGRIGHVLFVNDSKATNADSSAQALACFDDIFWIAGGKPKTGGIAPLRKFFPRMRKAYLIGDAAHSFAAELGDRVPHVIAKTLDCAIELAVHDADQVDAPAPVVLLSPACASFDQFRNFEVRGDAFRELVLALPGLVRR